MMWQATLGISRAQEKTEAAPQNPTPSEQRSEKDTHKRLERLACGATEVHFSHRVAKEHEPLPSPPPDKGLVYVIRNNSPVGAAGGVKLGVDGKWVGVNRDGNYFYLELDPGPHYFCAAASYYRGLLSLVIEKGKTYYLKQEITMTGVDLEMVDEERGQKYLAKYHRSIFEEKVKK